MSPSLDDLPPPPLQQQTTHPTLLLLLHETHIVVVPSKHAVYYYTVHMHTVINKSANTRVLCFILMIPGRSFVGGSKCTCAAEHTASVHMEWHVTMVIRTHTNTQHVDRGDSNHLQTRRRKEMTERSRSVFGLVL